MHSPHPQSRHLTTWVARPADEVYAYAVDPRHLPQWAAGLAGGTVEPDGEAVTNHLRVLPGPDGLIEVVFTLRRRPGMSAEEYDAAAVERDLASLTAVLEAPQG